MPEPRDRQFNLVVGFRGHGKSYYVSKIIRKSSQQNALIYVEDVDIDTPAWAPFPLVDFYSYKGGKVKICAQDLEYDVFLRMVRKHYRNGILVIDEGRLHENYKLSKGMIDLVSTCRKIGVDIYINYHGMSGLPIEQFHYVNNIILFHTTDNFRRKNNSIPEMKALEAAQRRIRAQVFKGNKYYAEVIPLVP